MYFVITAFDRPDAASLRLATRPTHRDYLNGEHEHVKVKLAGPLVADDNETMIGSMLVVEADSHASAEKFSEGDPYRIAGLFSEVTIRPWNWNTGNPDL
jgi:uncharacterized protein YciI